MTYMRTLFGAFCDEDEAEVRCLLTFSLFGGSPLIAANHRGRAKAFALAQDRLLA